MIIYCAKFAREKTVSSEQLTVKS